ncbi:hypothetical protein VM1G_12019 [Cytospora mali]|uniref:Uncharacterized protein n=1 Tax=Cytospora mali TaxID=578113 RepID=A0A194VI13_CYTMA|nr:hypothetical protein VM1G_12019 [Valsa mali]
MGVKTSGPRLRLPAPLPLRDMQQPPKILADMYGLSVQKDFLIDVDEAITAEKARVLVELSGYLGYSAILSADAHTWLRSWTRTEPVNMVRQ